MILVHFKFLKRLAGFHKFLTKIVIPESILYSQKNDHVFPTKVEDMRAFLGMRIVNGISLKSDKIKKSQKFFSTLLHDQTCTNVRLSVQESVLVDFTSQNKVKILHKVITCQNCLYQKFSHKNEQIFIIFYIF